jgi:hypothetical protein
MIPVYWNISMGAVVRHHSSVNESALHFPKNCCCSCFSFCNKNEQQDAKKVLNYRPNGLGWPLKRLLTWDKTGLSRPNLWWMMMINSSHPLLKVLTPTLASSYTPSKIHECKSASHLKQLKTSSLLVFSTAHQSLPFYNQSFYHYLLSKIFTSKWIWLRMLKDFIHVVVIPLKRNVRSQKIGGITVWLSLVCNVSL